MFIAPTCRSLRVGTIITAPFSLEAALHELRTAIDIKTSQSNLPPLALGDAEMVLPQKFRRRERRRPCIVAAASHTHLTLLPLATFRGTPREKLDPLLQNLLVDFGRPAAHVLQQKRSHVRQRFDSLTGWSHPDGRPCFVISVFQNLHTTVSLDTAGIKPVISGDIVDPEVLVHLLKVCQEKRTEVARGH